MCNTTTPAGRHHPSCLLSYLENTHQTPSVRSAAGSGPLFVSRTSAIFGHTLSEPCPFTDSLRSLEAQTEPAEPAEPEEPEIDYDDLPTPRCRAPRSPPGLNVHAGTWSWPDFQFSSASQGQDQENIPLSPKATALPQQPGYWLPPFLEEEIQGLSAEPVEDDEDGDGEETQTQSQFVKYQYHAGGNYFLPQPGVATEEVGKDAGVVREKGRGNVSPPELLSPYPDQLDEAKKWNEKWEAGMGDDEISQHGGRGWRIELPLRLGAGAG